jgi:hypothetical protein
MKLLILYIHLLQLCMFRCALILTWCSSFNDYFAVTAPRVNDENGDLPQYNTRFPGGRKILVPPES